MAEKKQGGGSILDQSHIMDLVHYLFGGFEDVFATVILVILKLVWMIIQN